MTRRCATCGVGHEQGEVVRRCDSCAFDYCDQHAATVDGVTKCHDCKEDDMRSAPIHDGTADTAEFDCGACGNRHPRFLPDDDGVAPEARGAATRTSLLWRVVVVLAIVALVVAKVAS